MSYCRFTSMSGRCEIYLYHGSQGYTLVVAANRIVSELPDIAEIDIEGYQARQRLLEANPGLVEQVPIELPYAGKSFCFEDKSSCIAMLKELKNLGYVMPEWLIPELEKESDRSFMAFTADNEDFPLDSEE